MSVEGERAYWWAMEMQVMHGWACADITVHDDRAAFEFTCVALPSQETADNVAGHAARRFGRPVTIDFTEMRRMSVSGEPPAKLADLAREFMSRPVLSARGPQPEGRAGLVPNEISYAFGTTHSIEGLCKLILRVDEEARR